MMQTRLPSLMSGVTLNSFFIIILHTALLSMLMTHSSSPRRVNDDKTDVEIYYHMGN